MLINAINANPHHIFKQLVIHSKDNFLIDFYKQFPISFSKEDYELLQTHRRYHFIFFLPKPYIIEFISKKRRNQQMLHDLVRLNNIDVIVLMLYKIRSRISNIDFVTHFFNVCEEILEKDYTKSPLFFSKNPLKFAFVIYLLLKTFNRRLKLQNEDFKRLAELYSILCVNIIDYLPQNALNEYIFHKDINEKLFLDYLFKIKGHKLASTRFIRKSIHSFWMKKIYFNQELIYY